MFSALLSMALVVPAAEGQGLEVRRFAFIAAANNGGPERPRLRYAETDARAVAGVLEELGGVAPVDRTVVIEPTPKVLLDGLDRLEGRLAAARSDSVRIELIVYYSGHSDETGLLLGEERFSYRALRSRLERLPADVRIAILDSCASGAFTRRKGGTRRPPFLVDASSQVQGYAVLTSSSENEAAQESDRIGASFFTHYLVTGLRGAADVSIDGRVTLNEAYTFAFHETLARTEKTVAGAQHPAYDIQLVGSGDLVMTDITATSASLELSDAVSGRVFVRDVSGRLVAELGKPAGRPVQLGLAPGNYRVTLESTDGLREGEVVLEDGMRLNLDPAELQPVEGEVTVQRGDVSGEKAAERIIPVNVGIFPAFSLNASLSGGEGKTETTNYLSLSLLWGRADRIRGLAIAPGATSANVGVKGAQLAGLIAYSGDEGVEGLQVAPGVAWSDGPVGLQLAGVLATAEQVEGLQIAAGVSVTRAPSLGGQLAGAVNVVQSMEGLQLAAGVNVAQTTTGAQIGGGVNYGGALTGLQLAAGVNIVGQLDGVQMGMLNLGRNVGGLQMGIINLAGQSRGFQLGLINLADEKEGESFGLISYARTGGILRPALWTSDSGLATAGLKLGVGHIYTLFRVGLGTVQRSEAWSSGLGIGVTFALSPSLRLDLDASANQVFPTQTVDGPSTLLQITRATLAWNITDAVALYGGPTLNVQVRIEDEDPDFAPGYAWTTADDQVRIWPGWSAGVEFF